VYRSDKRLPWEHKKTERIVDATKWARKRKWLTEVAQTPERDLRGHRIALTYHALAVDLYRFIYDVQGVIRQDDIVSQVPRVNANWFGFATWATATLNADIRNDDPPYRSDRLVPPGFYRRLTPTVLAIKSANRQRYNQLLTWYQRMVFINTTFAYNAMRKFDATNDNHEPFAWIDAATNEIVVVDDSEGDDRGDDELVEDLERVVGGVDELVEDLERADSGDDELVEDLERVVGALDELVDDLERAVDGDDESADGHKWMRDAQKLVLPSDGVPALERDRHLKPVAMAMEYYRRARMITLRLNELDPENERSKGTAANPTQEYYECLRARLVFFGNLIITSVEQDLVDPGVERVLNNVPIAAGDFVSNHLARIAQDTFGVPRQLAGLRIPAKLQPAQDAFQETWVRLLTRELLILALPAETLRLGRDIPPLAAGEPFFPPELFDLRLLPEDKPAREDARGEEGAPYAYDWPQQQRDNLDLLRTVSAFDRSQGDGRGTGARDWRRISQRLNWATTLIRTRIQDASLFWPPFRNEDVERIYRGKLPLHSGNPTDFDVLGPLESFPYLCGRSDLPIPQEGQ